jgi:hypothetical protein
MRTTLNTRSSRHQKQILTYHNMPAVRLVPPVRIVLLEEVKKRNDREKERMAERNVL